MFPACVECGKTPYPKLITVTYQRLNNEGRMVGEEKLMFCSMKCRALYTCRTTEYRDKLNLREAMMSMEEA